MKAKSIYIVVYAIYSLLILSNIAMGQEFQLVTVHSINKADEVMEYTDKQLKDIEDVKSILIKFMRADNWEIGDTSQFLSPCS